MGLLNYDKNKTTADSWSSAQKSVCCQEAALINTDFMDLLVLFSIKRRYPPAERNGNQ